MVWTKAAAAVELYGVTRTLCYQTEVATTDSDTGQSHMYTNNIRIGLHRCASRYRLIDASTGVPSKTPSQLTGKTYTHPELLYIVELLCHVAILHQHWLSQGLNSLACNLLHY